MKQKRKVPASVPFETVLDKHLKEASAKERITYLNACLSDSEDDGFEAFFEGLHDIARACGISELAEKVDKTRDTVNKMFAHKNPTVETFRSVLNGLGYDIAIVERK
jgi:DNA-binding phage protein